MIWLRCEKSCLHGYKRMTSARRTFLILDANVLIDLLQCDKMILPLISEYVGQVAVATTILEEVQEFTTDDCIELGILLVEPSLEQVMTAVENPGPLSFYDWLCFLLAEEGRWICVTNDKALRKQCASSNLTVMWEVEMLCLLVEAGGLPKEQCKEIIQSIKKNNPFFITDSIVESALRRLDSHPYSEKYRGI
jgi:predicted nucleic acid-binding protein